jgi:hypothetical protein
MPRSELDSTAGKCPSRSPETMGSGLLSPRAARLYMTRSQRNVTEVAYQENIATVCGNLIALVGLPDATGFKPNGRRAR